MLEHRWNETTKLLPTGTRKIKPANMHEKSREFYTTNWLPRPWCWPMSRELLFPVTDGPGEGKLEILVNSLQIEEQMEQMELSHPYS